MKHIEIADRAGVYLDDMDCLLRGQCNANVVNQLRVTMADVEDFIRGSASRNMANAPRFQAISAADELAQCAGPQGAVGIIIGLLLESE
jgi:hypothetical protein